MLLEYKYKCKVPSVLPGQTIFQEYLTRGRGFENQTVLKMFEDSVRQLSRKLHITRQSFLKQLSKRATLDELEKLESGVLLNLKAANNSLRVVESFSKKYASIDSQICLEDMSKTIVGFQCLQRLVGICRDMHQLFCEDSLSETQLNKFSKSMRAQLGELSNDDDPEQTDFHTQVELLLVNRFANTRFWEMNLRRYMHKARRALNIIDGVIHNEPTHENRIKRLLPLLQVKASMKTLKKFISATMEQSDIFMNLIKAANQISETMPQIATVIEATVLEVELQVATSIGKAARLSNIIDGTLPLEPLLELLKFIQELTVSRSEFDTWVLVANYEHKISIWEEYQLTSSVLKEKLEKLVGCEFAVDADDACSDLEHITEEYSLFIRSPIQVLSAVKPFPGLNVQMNNNPDYVNLVELIDSSKRLRKLCRRKEIVAWIMELKCASAKGRRYRRQTQTNLDSLRKPIEQIISAKEDITQACNELGGVLKVVYNNPFTANINRIKQLLDKYVWVRSDFGLGRLESLVTQFTQDGEGVKLGFEWGALYWSIARLLTKSIQFENLPMRIAKTTEDQYEKWCTSFSKNIRLRSDVGELTDRISKLNSGVAGKVASRLCELVTPFDGFLEVHKRIQQIQRKRSAIANPQVISSKLDTLFECVFTKKGFRETTSAKEQLQHMYRLNFGEDSDSCNLIKRRHDKFTEQFMIYAQRIGGTDFQGNATSLERYEQFAQLWCVLLKGTGGLECVTPQLQEVLTQHIKVLITGCCDRFVGGAEQSTDRYTSLFSTRLQAIQVLQIAEELVQTMLCVNFELASNIAFAVSKGLFGAQNLEESQLQQLTRPITKAVETIGRLDEALSNLQQFQKLKNILHRCSSVSEQLVRDNQDKSMLLNEMMQLFRPPDSGWWTIRARDSRISLFYGLSKQAVSNFLKGLISRIIPQATASEKDTIIEEAANIQGQTFEINSVGQFHCRLNESLKDQVFHMSGVFSKQLNYVYGELLKSVILKGREGILKSIEDLIQKCFVVQSKASEDILKSNCVIGFKPSVKIRCEEIGFDIVNLHNFASSVRDQDPDIRDLHKFSTVIKDLTCVSLHAFKEFKDLESGLPFFLYTSRSSLKTFARKGLLLLFKPETLKELKKKKGLIRWWTRKILLLPQSCADTLLGQLKQSYAIEPVIRDLASLTNTVKELVNRINQVNNSGQSSSTSLTKDRFQEAQDIELYLENLQFQSDSVRVDILERAKWLNELRDCMKSTCSQMVELRTWLQEAERATSEGKPDRSKVKELAASLRKLRPALGLEKEIRLLLDHEQQGLVAFVVSEEESPLASANKLLQRFYVEDLDFPQEVVNRCLQSAENGDIEVVPSVFRLSFFQVDVNEPDEGVHLQCYSVGLSVYGRQLQSNLPLTTVEVSLSIHEIPALKATLFCDGKSLHSSTEKLLSGNEILFTSVSSRVKVDRQDRASKLKLSEMEAASTNDASANNNMRGLPIELPTESVLAK